MNLGIIRDFTPKTPHILYKLRIQNSGTRKEYHPFITYLRGLSA